MGCDYTIKIQVRHGSHWIDVVIFNTKTRCGGGPLIVTMINFHNQDQNGARGDYGVEYPVASVDTGAARRFILTQQLDEVVDIPSKAKGENKENEEKAEEWDDHYDEEAYFKNVYRNKEDFMYYSKEQFAQFVDLLQKCEDTWMLNIPAERRDVSDYALCMRPLALWCELARSMLPMTEKANEIWMSSAPADIDAITTDIRAKRGELQAAYTAMLHESITTLPSELVDNIAAFAVPYADDVRVGIWDEEGTTKEVRRTPRGQEYPRRTDNCVVM